MSKKANLIIVNFLYYFAFVVSINDWWSCDIVLTRCFLYCANFFSEVEMTSNLADSLFSAQVQEDSITHLTVGAPGPSLLSRLPSLFREASESFLTEDSQFMFQYGPEAGTEHFRRELAHFLTRRYSDGGEVGEVSPGDLVLTTGATNGLHLVTSSLVRTGGLVFVENPTYFIALNILSGDMGLTVVPVNMTKQGMEVTELEESIAEAAKNQDINVTDGRFWGMIYTIPTFHNPTGVTVTRNVGERLISVAKKWKLLILCDDVYNLLNYSRTIEFSRLKALDTQGEGHVISNGSFSKILAPGVRLGWLEAPRHIVAKLSSSGVLLSGGAQNNLMSGMVTSLMTLGHLDTHLDHSLRVYGERMDLAVRILGTGLPPSWSLSHPGGGYFLWIQTDQLDLENFINWLKNEKKITVMPGNFASPNSHLERLDKECFKNSFRISIAYYDLAELEKACNDLCCASTEFVKQSS